MGIDDDKRAVRDMVWRLLERERVVSPGLSGRIPDFDGADRTAALVAGLEGWQRAQTVKANPDDA